MATRRSRASRPAEAAPGAEQQTAAREPGRDMTMEEVEAALQAQLSADRRWRRTIRRWNVAAAAVYAIGVPLTMVLAAVVMPGMVPDFGENDWTVIPPVALGALVLGSFYMSWRHAERLAQERLASGVDALLERLVALRDRGAASMLLVAYRDADVADRPGAAKLLRALLPRLQASDAQHVTREAMSVLTGLLSEPQDDLVRAALAALRQVGDETAVGPLEALVARPDRLNPWLELLKGNISVLLTEPAARGVREAARECLTYIRERRAAEEATALLLRPAETPDDAMLLRPACAGPESEPESLLRPVEPSAQAVGTQALVERGRH